MAVELISVVTAGFAFSLCGYLLLLSIRNRSAACRHLVCALTLAAVALSPFLVLLAAWAALGWAVAEPLPVVHELAPIQTEVLSVPVVSTPATASPAFSLDPFQAVLALWVLGLGALMVRWISSLVKIRFIVWSSIPLHHEVFEPLAERLARSLRVGRPVGYRLICEDDICTPFAAGWVSPEIVFPAVALEWEPELAEAVLAHELGHVRRKDCFWYGVAAFATAIQWFNPIVWLLAKRLHVEAENATDDLVLRLGMPSPQYASGLLSVTSGALRLRCLPVTAMAHGAHLKTRVLRIMDTTIDRNTPLSATYVAFAALAACTILPLTTLRRVQASLADLPIMGSPVGPANGAKAVVVNDTKPQTKVRPKTTAKATTPKNRQGEDRKSKVIPVETRPLSKPTPAAETKKSLTIPMPRLTEPKSKVEPKAITPQDVSAVKSYAGIGLAAPQGTPVVRSYEDFGQNSTTPALTKSENVTSSQDVSLTRYLDVTSTTPKKGDRATNVAGTQKMEQAKSVAGTPVWVIIGDQIFETKWPDQDNKEEYNAYIRKWQNVAKSMGLDTISFSLDRPTTKR